jgi:hypothetical protein
MRTKERNPLTCRLLRYRTAKLQGPIFFTTACDESNNGAKHRHDCYLLGHGFAPMLLAYVSTIIIPGAHPKNRFGAKRPFSFG